MMRVEKFKKEHYAALKDNLHALSFAPNLSDSQIGNLQENSLAYTVLDDDRIYLVGGVSLYWEGRGEAWCLLSKDSGNKMLSVTRIVQNYLNQAFMPRRVECSVEYGFELGHKWMRLLGFSLEAIRLRSFLPNGKDCSLYARVKEVH